MKSKKPYKKIFVGWMGRPVWCYDLHRMGMMPVISKMKLYADDKKYRITIEEVKQ